MTATRRTATAHHGFEIDHKAFRAQNLGRPPQQLIREAIQNAFDESPKHVTVEIRAATLGRGLTVTVVDDGPGFTDEKEIWTVFASGKRDNPTKRGRLGRGLKELISVAAQSEVVTAGKIVNFRWSGQTLTRSVKRKLETTGTKIVAHVPAWKASDLPKILDYFRLFVAPDGTSFTVNGVNVDRPHIDHTLSAFIKTIIYDNEGVPKETFRRTTLRLMRPGSQGAWIYEMGIPVEKISEEDGFEWSIDVGQRTPLRPERDMLPKTYVHSLYAHVANELMDKLPAAEMTDLWMEEAVGHYDFDKDVKGKVYVERRFGQNAARAVAVDPHDRNQHAMQEGVNVIRTEHLSASVRDLIKETLPTTMEMFPVGMAPARFIQESEWTAGEQRFVAFARWLANAMKLSVPTITVMDAPAASCLADSGASGTRIRINRTLLGSAFFDAPRLTAWVPLVIHELGHRTGNGHDNVFWNELERLSGEAAQAVRDWPEKIAEFGA